MQKRTPNSAPEKLNNPTIKLKDYSLNQEKNYDLDTTTSWIKEVLDDVESEIDPELREEKLAASTLEVALDILREEDDELKDHLIVRGSLKTSFQCHCIRCLTVMMQDLEQDFAYCYLPHEMEQDEIYQDATEVYCDGEEMDLHFYDKKQSMDLKEIIYEQIQLNMDPLPLHDVHCKGLCPQCGINLNKESCNHK